MRLAIDDTGAGFASLRHILNLEPDIIKLDISLTRGVDVDRARRALAAALIAFAANTGASIVAEGVETASELSVLRDLGVGFGQGYLLGRPGPLPATIAA
jgi:EAL domain-containing protein (putative c-di-GMP-specific phosphodiesterase class I)